MTIPSQRAIEPDEHGWIDIDTAPKDGTRVDLWNKTGRSVNAFWENELWTVRIKWVRSKLSRNVKDGYWHVRTVIEPTHWRPPPKPPVASTHPEHGGRR